MSNFLQLSVKLPVCRYYGAFWTHTKMPVMVLSIIVRKFTKKIFPFTSFFPFFNKNFSYPKIVFFAFCFLLYRRTTKANDVCMSSVFTKEFFLLSLVIISVWWE